MVLETVKLIDTIKKMYPVTQFFKDRYFPDAGCYYSEKALIEMRRGNRQIAPFVVPIANGITMESEGYKAQYVDAPYIAVKMPITPEDLEKKAFGESPESGRSPESRENQIEAEHMDDLRNSILRRHELMCTEIITDGKIVMKHYATAEDAAKGENYKELELRYYDTAFENTYTFSKEFASMTAQEKLTELYKMALILKKRGVRTSDIVMTSDVSMLLMTDQDFLEYYNKRAVETGTINQRELPEGVSYNGALNINGILFNLFSYDNEFVDLDGTVKEFLPAGTIAFLQPGMGKTVYAQVTFVQGTGFKSYAEKIVPRVVASEDNNVMTVGMFSRPVPYPNDPEGWLVANINNVLDSADESSIDSQSLDDEVTLLTEDEINALSTKAKVIEYGTSIGMTDLSDSSTLAELKAAVISYQQENYGE